MVTFALSQSVWEFANRVACVPAWSTCQRAKLVPTSHFHVPMYQKTCQRAEGVSMFQSVLLQNAKGNFCTLLLYKKFCIILDIVVIHIICICIVHKNCVILHLYTSCRIKVCGIFVFLKLFCSLVKNENTKRSGFYRLPVTRVFLDFPPLKQLKKMKNKCEYCDLLELWSA